MLITNDKPRLQELDVSSDVYGVPARPDAATTVRPEGVDVSWDD